MKRTTILVILVGLLAASAFGQYRRIVSSDGFVRRGKVNVPMASSAWSVNEESVRHTIEYYDSAQMARYILGRLRGTMHPASKIAPNAGALEFKVASRNSSTRIAWVCGNDLHYLEGPNAAVMALLSSWGRLNCG